MSLSLQFATTILDADKNVTELFNQLEKSIIQRGNILTKVQPENLFKVNEILQTILYPSSEESAYFIKLGNIDLAVTYEGCLAKSKFPNIQLDYILDTLFYNLHLILIDQIEFNGVEVKRNIELNFEGYEFIEFDFSNINLDKTLYISEFMEKFKEKESVLAAVKHALAFKYFFNPYEIRALINNISELPNFSEKLHQMITIFDKLIYKSSNIKVAQIEFSGDNYHEIITIFDGILWVASEADDVDMVPVRCTTEEFVVRMLYFVLSLGEELNEFNPHSIIRTFK